MIFADSISSQPSLWSEIALIAAAKSGGIEVGGLVSDLVTELAYPDSSLFNRCFLGHAGSGGTGVKKVLRRPGVKVSLITRTPGQRL